LRAGAGVSGKAGGQPLLFVFLVILTGPLSITVHVLDRSWNAKSDVYAMTLWSSLFQFILVAPFIGVAQVVSPGIAGLLLCVGALSAYARTRWFAALSYSGDSLSRLVPLTRASSFIVLILAALFLGERFTALAATGGVLMIFGGLLISMEQPSATIKEFLALNLSLLFVLFFALARAVNNVSYKWILDQGRYDFYTIYVYLKLFEFLAIGAIMARSPRLRAGFGKIAHKPVFAVARVVQTASGLLFIYVLDHMNISTAEPIAAIGPIFAVAWEWLDRRYGIIAGLGGNPPCWRDLSALAWSLRIAGTICIMAGFFLLEKGKA
jgi:drug/metabolite transporter (DMT)-like permease